jgi:hypothetical protein
LLPVVLAALARDPSRRPSAADLADLTAALDPGSLVRSPSGVAAGQMAARAVADGARTDGAVAAAAEDLSSQITRTALDMPGAVPGPAAPAVGNGAALADAAAVGGPAFPLQVQSPPAPQWPSTRPMAVRPRENFADLLPPVRYDQAAALRAATPGVPGQLVPVQPGPAVRPRSGPGANGSGAARPAAAAQALPAIRLLVLATLAGLVALSILLPIAGAAAALAAIVLLRACDGTARWLDGRRGRAGRRPSDPVSTALFYPLAVCRTAVACLLLAPVALLFAAAAAVLAVLALGPDQLSRVAGFAAGGLIAGYCVGPGSGPCRRPLTRFYGGVTRFVPAVFVGMIGVAGIAVAAFAAAKSLSPGFWPAGHLGNQLQTTSLTHPGLGHWSGNVADVGRRFLHWLGL